MEIYAKVPCGLAADLADLVHSRNLDPMNGAKVASLHLGKAACYGTVDDYRYYQMVIDELPDGDQKHGNCPLKEWSPTFKLIETQDEPYDLGLLASESLKGKQADEAARQQENAAAEESDKQASETVTDEE